MTDNDKQTFAVLGATGQQGGATARALLAAGVRVRALTRDPASAAARMIGGQGAEVVQADIEDSASLRAAFAGMAGVFAMTSFEGPKGSAGEVEYGRQIADAVQDAGVPHVVYSSVGGAERGTGIPHFESKRRIELELLSRDFSVTVLRPTFFMENFRPRQEDGEVVVREALLPGVPIQMIAADDIGAAATAALLDPSAVEGGALEIAGDELTGEQIAAVYGERAGLPARFEPLPISIFAGDPDLEPMFTWFSRPPAYQADLAATRKLVPGVQDLRTWVGNRWDSHPIAGR